MSQWYNHEGHFEWITRLSNVFIIAATKMIGLPEKAFYRTWCDVLKQQSNSFTSVPRNAQNGQNKRWASSETVRLRISKAFPVCLSLLISSVRGHFPAPHVNVTARSSAQFNVLLFKESKCQSSPPLQNKPWIIVISRKTRAECWNDSD